MVYFKQDMYDMYILVRGLCTSKLRSIFKRTVCLCSDKRTCSLSRVEKSRWNTIEIRQIRRIHRPKS